LPRHGTRRSGHKCAVRGGAKLRSARILPRSVPSCPLPTKALASVFRMSIIAAAAIVVESMLISASMRRRIRDDPRPALHPPASAQVSATSEVFNTTGAVMDLCNRPNAIPSTPNPEDAMQAWVASTGVTVIAQ
jgi:hypothetical protein